MDYLTWAESIATRRLRDVHGAGVRVRRMPPTTRHDHQYVVLHGAYALGRGETKLEALLAAVAESFMSSKKSERGKNG